jgi:hypothetical protein
MDVVTLARGKKTLNIFTRKKEGYFLWRHPGRPRLKGIFLFNMKGGPSRPRMSP